MGNPLKKALPWIDPIGNQGAKAIANTTGLGASPKTAAAAPGYNPSMNPGAQLHAPPPGGPPQGAPGGLFGGGATSAGYAPNPWQGGGSTGSVGPGLSGPGGSVGMPPPGATGSQGMPSPGPWLGRGGSNSSPQLQQQVATAQALRQPVQPQQPMINRRFQ